MLVGTLASVVLVAITVMIHFEALNRVQAYAERSPVHPRYRVVVMLFGAFAAHTLEVYVYAVAYLVIALVDPNAQIVGTVTGGFVDYLYFSAITYTTAGYGDLYPTGDLRLLSGTEALNGLVLITWTASVTYLMMSRYWRHD